MKIGITGGIIGIALLSCCPVRAATNPALPPFATGTFPGFGAKADFNMSIFGNSGSQDVLPSGAFSLGYDAATQKYTINLFPTGPGTVLGPDQLRSRTDGDETYSSSPTYMIGTGTYTSLTLLRNVASNPKIDLSYTSYAVGYMQAHTGVGRDYIGSFGGVIGQSTPPGALPRSGAAYYTGIVDGYAYTQRLSGTGEILLNFYSGEVATGMNLSAGGTFLGRVDGRGLIAGGTSRFAGDLFGSGNSLLGRFTGSLFGPSAQEAGYGFSLVGGGGGRTVAGVLVAAQTGLPGGAPPPVPSAPVSANTSLIAPLVSESFATKAGRLMANADSLPNFSNGQYFYSGTIAAVARAIEDGGMTIRYDAATASYTVIDGSAQTIFTPADRTTQSNAIFSDYSVNPYMSAGQNLVLFKNGPANPYLQLTYLSYGLWSEGTAIRQPQNNYRAFIYGVQTPAADLPRSGAALYNGAVDGFWSANGVLYRLQGSDGSILANLSSGEVRTTMRLVAKDIGGYPVTPAPLRVDGYGSIAAGTSQFAGTHATSDNAYSGTFQGAFFGPAHQEAGASFVLRGQTSTTSITGVLVATQAPLN